MATLSLFGNSVSYDEVPGSPQEMVQGDGFKVRRTFLVEWNKRWLFVYGMLGGPYFNPVPLLDYGWISRRLPQGYKTTASGLGGNGGLPSGHWMFPLSVEGIEGLGKILSVDADGVATYEKAKVSLLYETVTWKILSDAKMKENGYVDPSFGNPDEATVQRYVTKFYQPTAEYLTLPFMGMVWSEQLSTPVDLSVQPVAVPGSLGVLVPATEIMYLWRQVPGRPLALDTHIGSVNDAEFDGYRRGTLLLTSIDLKPYRWFLGQIVWDITYKMKYFEPQTKPHRNAAGNIITDANGIPYDSTTDRTGTAINEYYGHNHFLRYKPGGNNTPDGWLDPVYNLISHNGVRPTAGFSVNRQMTTGRTVYEYKDFKYLFRLQAPDGFQGAFPLS